MVPEVWGFADDNQTKTSQQNHPTDSNALSLKGSWMKNRFQLQ
jgi:hypothetical protein